ncbi:WD40-repeat-containing domain protein [Dichotomocladium elegans]|nr:WD40-repeat-containing domain protein [Dichotomocladium elegans]
MDQNHTHLRFVQHIPSRQEQIPRQSPVQQMDPSVIYTPALMPLEQMQPQQHPSPASQTGNSRLCPPQPPIWICQSYPGTPADHDNNVIIISSDEEETGLEAPAPVRKLGQTIEDAISLIDDENEGDNGFMPAMSPVSAATSLLLSEIKVSEAAMSGAPMPVITSLAPGPVNSGEPIASAVASASDTATSTVFEDNELGPKEENEVEHSVAKVKDENRNDDLQQHVQQEPMLEYHTRTQEHMHKRDVNADTDEAMIESSDNESISSSDLLFGEEAADSVNIDVDLLYALNAPDTDDEDVPDWKALARLNMDDNPTARLPSKPPVSSVDTAPPTNITIKTYIPPNANLAELLSQIEAYKESVRFEPAAEAVATATHVRENSKDINNNNKRSIQKRRKITMEKKTKRPYVPCRIWSNATWEDWAQFEIGDWLHWPFEDWEVKVLDERLEHFNRMAKKHRPPNKIPSFAAFEYAAEKLSCRRVIDCQRYWEDRSLGLVDSYNKPVIIIKGHDDMKKSTLYDVIGNARYQLSSRSSSAKTVLWSNLDCERTFGEGSADCLAVKIINDPQSSGVKVIAGCACNDQPEYNAPGNLRLWTSEDGSVKQLRAHRDEVNTPTGAHQMWFTVTDVCVSNDHRFFFSCSHDKTARVWDSRNGRMLSTLVFHDQKIHQMAISPDPTEHILGTASADGSAVVWRLGSSGDVGSGQVCELDVRITNNSPQPSIDTLAFGNGPSKGMLFTGVVTGLVSPGGFIQVFDAGTGHPILRFESMRSAVCDLDVSSSGRYIASGNYSVIDDYSGDGYVHINDVRQPQSVIKAKTNHPDVNVVRMSPCERYIASGNLTNETAVLDIRRPDRLLYSLCHNQTIAEHLVPVNSDGGISGIHWMANSKYLVTGGGDCSVSLTQCLLNEKNLFLNFFKVKIWDVWGSGDIVRSYPTSTNVASLAVDEDAMLICAGTSAAQGYVHIFSPYPL